MRNKMVLSATVSIYVLFLVLYAFLTGDAMHNGWMTGAGLLAAAMILLLDPRNLPQLFLIVAVTGMFQYTAGSDGSYVVYMLLVIRYYMESESNLKRIYWLTGLLTVLCMSVMHAYTGLTRDSMFTSLTHAVLSVALVLVLRQMRFTADEKRQLKEKNGKLQMLDSLTGLLNYQAFHRRMADILGKDKGNPYVLVLIDFRDFRSLYKEKGFSSANETLRRTSRQLDRCFPYAVCKARYGGDEFAVLIPEQQGRMSDKPLLHMLSRILPEKVGMALNYGYAYYPGEAATKDGLVALAEKRLYGMKKEVWLKQEEQMLRTEKLRTIGELAAGMAHEIRNPLTAVKGFVQVAMETGEIRRWYPLIENELSRMNNLISEFLSFSRINTANSQSEDLKTIIHAAIQLAESEATRRGHQIVAELEEIPLYACVDKDKIIQVLLNMIKNGLEAMEEAGQLDIQLLRMDGKAGILIKDEGKGMTGEELEKIFEPFYTTKEEGTGLGLAISYAIVQEHGGEIQVSSEAGKGATFRIGLPLTRPGADRSTG